MPVPDKKIVVSKLEKKYGCSFSMIKGKKIMYQGIVDEEQIVVCTKMPSRRLLGCFKMSRGMFVRTPVLGVKQ
ncbi:MULTISPECIES: hypothetical protein [Paenibacillus]|jgi:hypothetical protein|uniref:Uncharacterized protein n=1 Tax=Paenibacillus antibioticophila TaxID=1274374 RepID=A0A919XS14_9BACL|nr:MULTISPECIES: hypothetical protein [Paenibacillus]OXL81635.1 hypothetical protein BCV73_00050 [Paenibacillus sp. SSG-1]GIO38177.1 hypothetical protein J41TS12_30380 [Paenibacillus antibioticophila]GJM78163.1 hypothetical protein HMSSN139_06590 [Paenibacillus sp. HMSSN-139]